MKQDLFTQEHCLSLGLASALIIMLYVKDEVGFDGFQKNVNQIYRVVENLFSKGKNSK